MTLIQFIIINVGALIAAFGGIFLKELSVSLNHQESFVNLFTLVLKSRDFWLAGVCYVFPIFLWIYLLKTMELTKLQPLLSTVYIYTVFLSIFFLGESPSLFRIFGISLIFAGVFIVSRT
jgi:drug/metabolite transporter (DMT)-like permease